MPFNLRNRSFVKELDFTPEELRFLLKLFGANAAAAFTALVVRGPKGANHASSLGAFSGSGLRSTTCAAAVVDVGGVGVEHPLKVRWRAATVKAINWVFIEEALQRNHATHFVAEV